MEKKGTPSPNKGTEPSSNGREDSDIDINILVFLCNEENIDNDLDVIVESFVFFILLEQKNEKNKQKKHDIFTFHISHTWNW